MPFRPLSKLLNQRCCQPFRDHTTTTTTTALKSMRSRSSIACTNVGLTNPFIVQQPQPSIHYNENSCTNRIHLQKNGYSCSGGGAVRFMHLSPREVDHLKLYHVGRLSQNRLARGIKLNYPEAIGLIGTVMLEHVRSGKYTVAELMGLGQTLLGYHQVQPGVSSLIGQVQVEGTFPDGTKLLTIHEPICRPHGDLEQALFGSFLPIPDVSIFETTTSDSDDGTIPGEVRVNTSEGDGITLNAGRETIELTVVNTGDRPIQVGSHYAFIETNKALKFDRYQAIGKRLDVPSGASVRFEPGESKRISLTQIGGNQRVVTGNRLMTIIQPNKTVPDLTEADKQLIVSNLVDLGFLHEPESKVTPGVAYVMDRWAYSDTYGPTTGDTVTLGDTQLTIRVEKDYTTYGDECKFGGGKTLREGMGQNTGVLSSDALDTVITNALIVDPILGIIKADIGLKGQSIVGIGKAGNPDIMDGVSPNMIVGATTDVIAGEKLIITAGGIDTHIHWICPQQIEEAVASGVTTMFGGGTGPSAGTSATTCTPAPLQIHNMLLAVDQYALNFGFSGKGNTSDPKVLYDVLAAGAAGFKLHEDWGTTPSSIEAALDFAEEYDIPITIHTDTLNESGFVDDSIAAMKGRTIHTYHTEGAGGGHAPDILKIVQESHVLPSSTNPTRPFTINTIDEHLDMLMVCHHLDSSIPEDVAFAESRIRAETIAAEDILHDMGAISMISSDSQAMGRVGEVITRTWQTADKMKQQMGPLPEDADNNDDNFRVKRYLAKYTINPAITHGFSHLVGSIEVGKMADLVLWKPAMFGAKPEMIIKGGMISYAQMGDPNASIPTPQPVLMRPMFGANTAQTNSVHFISQTAYDVNKEYLQSEVGLLKPLEPIKNCRQLTKSDMVHNGATPTMSIDPETFEVVADGKLLRCEPATKVSLGQKYVLF